jgi:Fe-S-cluster-containing hydrogenase component 2
MSDVYDLLREHLDRLPAGFPATGTGVELRILRRLFSPEEAGLATHLTLRQETAAAIAARADLPEGEAEERLRTMARRGLVFSVEEPDRPPRYLAAQFVIGIWEYQVNSLDPELIRDVEEYLPSLGQEAFRIPQLRTVPVGRSIGAELEVLPHEQAEEIVRRQTKFLVAPCICRREQKIKGGGCDRLLEACLVFGWGADYYARNGLGRFITLEETLDILRRAEEQGLVLQPSNTREIVNICCCCGDCCQVLLHLKRLPSPARAVSSPFVTALAADRCIGCGACAERCPMGALALADDRAVQDPDRCIGCGLCVTTCPTGALALTRKPEELQRPVPRSQREAFLLRARMRAGEREGDGKEAESGQASPPPGTPSSSTPR